MVLKRYTTITPLNRPGFDAHFVMCEPRALARLLSVVLFLCLRQRTPLKTVHEALCVVPVDPCRGDLLKVSQCCNRPVRNGEPSLYTRSYTTRWLSRLGRW